MYNKSNRGANTDTADDTNLLYVGKTLKKIQKYVNLDLKFLCNWLKANKISLNASKTELIIFRDPRKKSSHDLKIEIDGKKLIPSRYVKYLGILLDCHFSWNEQDIDMQETQHLDHLSPALHLLLPTMKTYHDKHHAYKFQVAISIVCICSRCCPTTRQCQLAATEFHKRCSN